MKCPRCRTENGEAAIRCSGCGVPIALGDEPARRPVEREIRLDRRAAPRPLATPPGQPREPAPAWEMEPPDDLVPVPEPVHTPVHEADAEVAPEVDAEADDDAYEELDDVVEAEMDVEMDVDAVEVHRVRAPAWRRIVAWAVDGALLGALLAALLLPVLGPVVGAAGLESLRDVALPAILAVALVAFAYQWLGVTLMGATPGMLVAGLRVVGPDGHRPSPGRSAIRALSALPSAALLGIGVLLALITRSGRGAHDLVAGTWVVVTSPGGAAP